MPSVARSLHEDETVSSHGGRTVELPLGRRYAFLVLVPVVEAEQPYVDVAPIDFVQAELVRPQIGGRDILEQEDFEEPPVERVGPDVVARCRTFSGLR